MNRTEIEHLWRRYASHAELVFLGRPLYESMGFALADDIDAWTRGASPKDLAAVGA